MNGRGGDDDFPNMFGDFDKMFQDMMNEMNNMNRIFGGPGIFGPASGSGSFFGDINTPGQDPPASLIFTDSMLHSKNQFLILKWPLLIKPSRPTVIGSVRSL